MSASLAPSSVCFYILSHSYRSSTLIKTKDFHSSWEWSSTKADCTSQVCSETHQQVVRWNLHITPLHPSHSVLSSLHALSAHSGSPSAHRWEQQRNGRSSFTERLLFKWTLTGWGRQTGSASPPASPSGPPAGSCGRTAPSRTCSLSLQWERCGSQSDQVFYWPTHMNERL